MSTQTHSTLLTHQQQDAFETISYGKSVYKNCTTTILNTSKFMHTTNCKDDWLASQVASSPQHSNVSSASANLQFQLNHLQTIWNTISTNIME